MSQVRSESLVMLIANEKSSLSNANIYLDFYASKEAQGIELDLQERSDRDFWAANLTKITERLAFFEQELATEVANGATPGSLPHAH
jgi:hypothetical protein